MSRTVTALYDTPEEARQAAHVLNDQVPVAFAGSFDRSLESLEALQSLDLSKEELAACRLKLASGGYLLVAIPEGEDISAIVDLLEHIADGDGSAEAPAFAPGSAAANPAPERSAAEPTQPAGALPAEQGETMAEEEVRLGSREIVRGGATVSARDGEPRRLGEVELIEEIVRVETRPASRLVSDEELEQAGLLKDRLIEIAQMREEPVIEKQAFVREEVVVTKTTERRVEPVLASAPPLGETRSNAPAGQATRELEDSHGRS